MMQPKIKPRNKVATQGSVIHEQRAVGMNKQYVMRKITGLAIFISSKRRCDDEG